MPALNPEYTFERFVSTEHNRLAYESARGVAGDESASIQQPSNPLFIYGTSDRAHLLGAIANYALGEGRRVIYINFKEFVTELKRSQQEDSLNEFRDRFRTPDFLLINDIQAITRFAQGERQEFFHTLDDLISRGHQVVLGSDRHPNSIQLRRLGPELHSRFSWGLVVDVKSDLDQAAS